MVKAHFFVSLTYARPLYSPRDVKMVLNKPTEYKVVSTKKSRVILEPKDQKPSLKQLKVSLS